jgi:Gram-negative bacterial TonB protein C-terminal
MNFWFLYSSFFVVLCLSSIVQGQTPGWESAPTSSGNSSDNAQSLTKVPTGVILVKGAWSSASDSVTPVPEGGTVAKDVFSDRYFGITYPLPLDWTQDYEGPPPSESGRYVLAQIGPGNTEKKPVAGSILITAQDMFFTPFPAADALELTRYIKDHLQADYQVETPPTTTKIANGAFTFLAYWSPVAQLHWYVLITEIRCHAIEVVLTSRDTKLLENLMLDLNKMKLPEEASPTAGNGGGEFPVCVKDYAEGDNVLARVDPLFTERRFNPVPVRIIIDKQGKIKHIHFLSAFPDQATAVRDALAQWKFKPYQRDGKPVEVETGIMFGQSMAPRRRAPDAATE